MAHNPPIPARIDFADRLGVLIMDENRDYGGHRGQGGYTAETVAQETIDMGDMVQRDRAHPSVFIWSFCNEGGCEGDKEDGIGSARAGLWIKKKNRLKRRKTKDQHGVTRQTRVEYVCRYADMHTILRPNQRVVSPK